MPKTAGEHWVCSVLAQSGWGPALTRDGLARTDILAVKVDKRRRMIEVQVKTASPHTKPSWPLGTNSQSPALSPNEWFVLVALNADPTIAPASYIVPRDHVAAAAWMVHEDWRTDPSAKPGTRNATVERSRVFAPIWERYRERWDLLDAPTDEAPVLLPPRLRELATDPRVGLPEGHPWRKGLPEWEL